MSMLWGYGLAGVWLGAAAGWQLCGAVFAIVLWRTDWDKEARKVTAGQGKQPSHRHAELELEPTAAMTAATREDDGATSTKRTTTRAAARLRDSRHLKVCEKVDSGAIFNVCVDSMFGSRTLCGTDRFR